MPAVPKICKCLRCNHTWATRGANVTPRICPVCKSAYWDVPRKRPGGKK